MSPLGCRAWVTGGCSEPRFTLLGLQQSLPGAGTGPTVVPAPRKAWWMVNDPGPPFTRALLTTIRLEPHPFYKLFSSLKRNFHVDTGNFRNGNTQATPRPTVSNFWRWRQ